MVVNVTGVGWQAVNDRLVMVEYDDMTVFGFQFQMVQVPLRWLWVPGNAAQRGGLLTNDAPGFVVLGGLHSSNRLQSVSRVDSAHNSNRVSNALCEFFLLTG